MFSNKISIFSKNSERVNLIFPVLFAFFAFIQFALRRNFYSENIPAMEFFLNYIFLNRAHVIFTFIFLFFVPEFKELLVEKTKTAKVNPWLCWFGFFLGFFFFFEFLPKKLLEMSYTNHEYFLVKISRIYGMWHSMAQTMGLGILYNKTIEQTLSPNERIVFQNSKAVNYERKLVYSSFFFCMAYFVMVFIFPSPWLNALPLISMGLILLNLYFNFVNPQIKRSNKSFFLLRTLLLPIGMFSNAAFMGFLAIHAVEYFLVFLKIIDNSSIQKEKTNLLVFNISLLMIAGFILINMGMNPIKSLFYKPSELKLQVLIFIFALGNTMTYLHFYIDGQLFRMKNFENRKYLGPLLTKKNTSIGKNDGAA